MADGGGTLLSYGPAMQQREVPAEICYLAKQRPDRQYDSWQQFEKAKPEYFSEPKSPARDHTQHWDAEFKQHLAQQKQFNPDHQPSRKDTSHESEILRRADAVQASPGARRRRGRRIAQAHDEPVAYCRQALLEKLEREGICPMPSDRTVAA